MIAHGLQRLTNIRYADDIPPFQFEELERVLKGMTNLRGADEDGVVVEMIKYASKSFKDTLLSFYIQRLLDVFFDES